jgi:protein O-GlcNAc transferase
MAPNHPTSWAELGDALHHLGRLEEAEAAFAKGVSLSATSTIAALGLANVLCDRGRPAEAQKVLDRALESIPDNEFLLGRYSTCLGKLARMDRALSAAESALLKFPRSWQLAQTACPASNYVTDDPVRLFQIHSRFGRIFEGAGIGISPSITNPDPERTLRIGILSADLRGHSVSHFVEPILKHIDRTACAITMFSVGPSDDVTARLRNYGHPLLELLGKPRKEILASIKKANIDILLDLSGHTLGGDVHLLRSRPVPLIGNYCGYPNSVGMKSIDFRLVDAITDPPGEADKYNVEELVRIEGCFLCFEPRPESIHCEIETVPGLKPTFGSFNAARKISDEYLALCRGVLERVPKSGLVFKSLDFRAQECAQLVQERAAAAGIDVSRLRLIDPTDASHDHLQIYRQIHVALDTFPYSGTTTTCEALFMGVPVVTLLGRSHAARVSASLLRAADIENCIATSPAEYVDLAAQQMEHMLSDSQGRAVRRAAFLSSDLCNGQLFASRFAAALRTVWRRAVGAVGPHGNGDVGDGKDVRKSR